jgi:hypothetical protein
MRKLILPLILLIASNVKSQIHTIGESYGGGIVFFVYDGGQHGLIAAKYNTIQPVRWNTNTGTFIRTLATASGIGAGKTNTTLIIARQGPSSNGSYYAAQSAMNYSVAVDGVTYADWYLPSYYELNLLYAQKDVVGGFGSGHFWSSTEVSKDHAVAIWFSNGARYSDFKFGTFLVRAIRSF